VAATADPRRCDYFNQTFFKRYRTKPEATDLEQTLQSAPIRLRRQPEDRERARPGDRAVDLSNTEFD
jgi:hypothetical protein